MRRKKEEKPKLFSTQNIVGLFIVMIMIMSVLGFMINEGETENSGDYNGHEFVMQPDGYYTLYDGKPLKLNYHPSVSSDISLSYEACDAVRETSMAYFTFDPKDENIQYIEEIRLELETEMPQLFSTYILTGITQESEQYAIFSTIDCANATISIPVIKFMTADEEGFEYSGNCLVAKAKTGNDLRIMKDRLMLGISGIVE